MINAVEEISSCAISGSVGTFANIDPYVEEYVAKALNLNIEPISKAAKIRGINSHNNSSKSISKLYRIGNAHDMPTKFNATQLQNVWVNMPKNPEGQK